MGDVISTHLDEGKREMITAQTGAITGEFGRLYEQQYAVALFNKMRFDVEGGGGPQPQLLHRKVPLENKSIFSGTLFQYLEENKKWRNRFLFVPDSYNVSCHDNKAAHERGQSPKGTINCAGYKVLTSMEPYLELVSNSLPAVKAKVGSSPFLKYPTQYPLLLWHPYARHYHFCVATETDQQKWFAVFQDCVRHANDALSDEDKVNTPAFTDAVRLYRQAKGHYGTWDMMCGMPPQILSNLVMEGLLPELRELIAPRLKGKLHEVQRTWTQISDAIYSLVQCQCQSQYEAVVEKCEAGRPLLETSIRTDMDQIITSKEHVANKIKGVVLPKAEKLLKVSIEPYIGSILEALMEPTSRGFSEVREVFFRELVDMSKNTLNHGAKETVAEHMEKISMLAFHPVKMQPCYERVEQLSLEGLQQRFDVFSPSVFVQRAQILMREQMDNAVYTFEQILHQSLESQGTEELCKTIQRCQDRVLKKFDYDSSSVRKRFFREALLQIFIPYMLKQLSPSCSSELPRFQELIFEDFSRFILVETVFEEVVLHSVMKDIMMAVKEAAVQRRHNLYRDSMVLTGSDPNLHLLGEEPPVDWAQQYGEGGEDQGDRLEVQGDGPEEVCSQRRRRMKQVVSLIPGDSSPGPDCDVVEFSGIPEEGEEESEGGEASASPGGPVTAATQETAPSLANGSALKDRQAVVPQEELAGGGRGVSVETDAWEAASPAAGPSVVNAAVASPAEISHQEAAAAPESSHQVAAAAAAPESSHQVAAAAAESSHQVAAAAAESSHQVAAAAPESSHQVAAAAPESSHQVAAAPESSHQVAAAAAEAPESSHQVAAAAPEIGHKVAAAPESSHQVAAAAAAPESSHQVAAEPLPPALEAVPTSLSGVELSLSPPPLQGALLEGEPRTADSPPRLHDDSGFQSPACGTAEAAPVAVVIPEEGTATRKPSDFETGEQTPSRESQ